VCSDVFTSSNGSGVGSGLHVDGFGLLSLGLSVRSEGSRSGASGNSLFTISVLLGGLGSFVGFLGFSLFSSGLLLGSKSTIVVLLSEFELILHGGLVCFSIFEFLSHLVFVGFGGVVCFDGSGMGHAGFTGGDLGLVPVSEGMELEGFGGGGSFGGLEFGVNCVSLYGHGFDGGFLGAVVLGNGSVVLLDGSEPFGVPFSLDSDLLGSDVLGAEVEFSFVGSGSDELHVLGKVDGTSSLGFLEGVKASEEAVVGEVGGLGCGLGGGFGGDISVLLTDVLGLLVAVPIVPLSVFTPEGGAVFSLSIVVRLSSAPVGVLHLLSTS